MCLCGMLMGCCMVAHGMVLGCRVMGLCCVLVVLCCLLVGFVCHRITFAKHHFDYTATLRSLLNGTMLLCVKLSCKLDKRPPIDVSNFAQL
jgi:hypothetical protein